MNLEAKLKQYRLNNAEYEMAQSLVGRELKPIEWPLFSALWSEHCSYKSSRVHLKKFGKTLNKKVLNAEGENAGVIDLGHNERIVFKMESHNHPSFIEPYQGAATGVGGILRDIFTMGARPIAIADYLCFGIPGETPRMKKIVDGVVRGISGYGNCVGVPTVTGQTNFNSSYNNNVLVNAMAVGLLKGKDKVALSGAKGPGNLVVYVGAKTGKDGVHGASMASESFSENSEAKRPTIQIGDPYYEKLLIESCLDVLQTDLVTAIQDMGAAGLTSSSFEMAAKGGVGMKMHLDRVPLRDSTMTPEDILLSESQERMLLVCEPQNLEGIQKVFKHWGLDATPVGEITKDKNIELYWHNELLTSIDPNLLVDKAPMYNREFSEWSFAKKVARVKSENLNFKDHVLQNMGSVHLASRHPIYNQYDQRVGASTAHGDEYDVAFVQLPESRRGLAIAVGCRPELMSIDAYYGALDAVFYPSFQMALKGAKPIAVTDCLNFGNPEKKNIMSEFVASVDAITKASLALDAPVISGNVSFYNETLNKNIISTPATGVVGLRESVENLPVDHFLQEGLSVYLLELTGLQLGAEQFSGELKVEQMVYLCESLQKLSSQKIVKATQMVGLEGLGLALVKMSLEGFGIQSKNKIKNEELTEKKLYQCIFAVTDAAAFEKELKGLSSDIHWKLLGETLSGRTLINESEFDIKNLSDLYKKGLRSSIENLA